MTIRNKLAIALVAFLAPMVFASTASAAAGTLCSGTTCGLGGQIRGQIGDGLPLPISIAPARTGPFADITIQTAPATPMGLPLVGKGLGQPGQIKPTAAATIMQTLGPAPRGVTLAPEKFGYGGQPQGSIGVVNFNLAVFAVQTNLIFDSPHPGTDGFNNVVVVPGGGGSRMLAAGGRPGAATVTYCVGAAGSENTNFGGACVTPGDGVGVNGIMRYTKTTNQFGGISTGRTLGTAKVYFNVGALTPAQVPCAGPGCVFGLSTVIPGTTGVAGGPFAGTVMNAAFETPTGIYTGSVGFNGTILAVGNAVTAAGAGIPFTGQAATSAGGPLTTGKMTVSVTLVVGATPEIFKRTGIDARDAGGNGVIGLNSGAMSARTLSLGNANRTTLTLEIPEPSAIFAASAGLFALLGCHQLVRRRNR